MKRHTSRAHTPQAPARIPIPPPSTHLHEDHRKRNGAQRCAHNRAYEYAVAVEIIHRGKLAPMQRSKGVYVPATKHDIGWGL